MFLVQLFEAGIKTAEIDKLARAAVGKAIPEAVRNAREQAEPHLPPLKMIKYGEGEEYPDASEQYSDLSDYFHEDKNRLILPMLETFSKVLTQVVRDYVVKIIPTLPHYLKMMQEGGYTAEEFANHYTVHIESAEDSEDEYAKWAGGYMGFDTMKVFVKNDAVFKAGMDLIAKDIIGDYEDGYNQMLAAIVPTFTHEYAHLEQHLRRARWERKQGFGKPYDPKNPVPGSRDFGYVTVGKKNRRHKNSIGGRGGRGEWARTPQKGWDHKIRYTGNVKEIDSFASGAAAEMMHSMHADAERSSWGRDSWNNSIDELKKYLIYGDTNGSGSYQRYKNFLEWTFEGHFDQYNFKREEMVKVWQKFVKKVSQKLDDYKTDMTGVSQNPMRLPDASDQEYMHDAPKRFHNLDPEMVKLAQRAPFAETVKILAGRCARKIVQARSSWNDPIEYASKGYGEGMTEAEMFIDMYYFGDKYGDPNAKKAQQIFRKITVRRIQELMAAAKEDA